ncbi:MAG: GNAT family N-acetyltransferase [Bacteroidetes bacterium]|nr:GNAT family N-acetyltransferase [Bacteroidota bacterium]
MKPTIGSIKLRLLKKEDFEAINEILIDIYKDSDVTYWKKHQIDTLIDKFPEGQIVIEVDNQVVGAALAIIVDSDEFDDDHTYREITDNFTFRTHSLTGNTLYGIDVFIGKKFRGLRLGRRFYDYRKELCEQKNLKSIVFGGRLPHYHKYANEMSAKEYIQKVRSKEIFDPVLNFQLSNDFHVIKVLENYLSGDAASKEFAALLKWDNIYYKKPKKVINEQKVDIRLGLVQWQMRRYNNLEELFEQMEFFIDAVSGYRSDFALFPEFFNGPLMAESNHLSEPDAIRELTKYTDAIRDQFSKLAIEYNINIITGSMPYLIDDVLYNIGHLCKRNGEIEQYFKIHVTPDEAKVWGLKGGKSIKTFDTDCGKIGILICYDVEFPELGRLLADEGMNILFVPFLTDTQNGYARVRNCAMSRAVENECYVAIAGSVGNLPKVHNMDIQYAQSAVFTPCDFAFPLNGIKAESTPNTEMILIADVNIDLLKELHKKGSVRNLNDRRKDLYNVIRTS